MEKKAVVLLSGGIDSSTVLAVAKEEGFELYALSFDYGQRNNIEVNSAGEVAKSLGVKEHRIFKVDLKTIGGSALTGGSDIPKGAKASGGIPVTYVPGRNTIFLSVALAWTEILSAKDIFIGVNVIDYSGYPDCRPDYIDAFEKLAGLATASGKIRIRAPLMHMTKSQIIEKGLSLGVDFSKTQSCYDPASDGVACGECESCRIRLKGFREAGITDPIQYKSRENGKRR